MEGSTLYMCIWSTCTNAVSIGKNVGKRSSESFNFISLLNLGTTDSGFAFFNTLNPEKLHLQTNVKHNQLTSQIYNFKPSCSKNRSCRRPDQQHSSQSRFFPHCSCRTDSCLLGLGTCRWPSQRKTRCSCRWCRSSHQKSHCHWRLHWSFLHWSCQWLCSFQGLEEVEWLEGHRLKKKCVP